MIYLAGPFFNAVQRQLIETLAAVCETAKVPCYCPWKSVYNRVHKVITPEVSALILKENMDNIDRADTVVAVMDWLLPEGSELMVKTPSQFFTISLPDSGTVWEMGYATARQKPIIGYCQVPAVKRNVMLVSSCMGFCLSMKQFMAYLADGVSVLSPWKWEIQ